MSNISPIGLTKIASGSGIQNAQALSGSSTGLFANVTGLNFMDLIIARLTADETQKTAEKPQTTEIKDTANLQKQNPLTLLQLALASQTTDENGNIVLGDAEGQVKKLETQLGLTNKIINHLKNVLPENPDNGTIFQKLLTKLQTKSDTLQASLSALESGVITKDTPVEDIPLPILILFGLNPSEITDVTNKVQELEAKLGRDITVEDMIVGVGGLLPPPQTSVLASISVQPPKIAQETSDITGQIDDITEPTDDLAARLNALDVGGESSDPMKANEDSLLNTEKEYTPAKPELNIAPEKKAALHLTKGVDVKNMATLNDMTIPANMSGADIESAIIEKFGLQPTPSLSLGNTAQSANIIATSATAGQPHPAANMIAAHISKFANPNTGDQTMMLRLDPPELGNVAIRLKFGRDNSVKAHITVEKPETYMMLQRDALTLERTLQNSGFDTSGSAISFELANQGDNPFNNNGEGGGEKDFGKGGIGNGQDALSGDNIIQSSVMWQIDPDSGHVRYNIFA